MDSALLIGRGENPLTFPIGLVLDDQLFDMRILASHHLELQREYLTKENNRFMFDILNWGILDQDVITLRVGEPKYPLVETVRATLPLQLLVRLRMIFA